MDERYDINALLDVLPPGELSYQEWLTVGMALHNAGAEASVWDTWSARDAARYHPGECERKYKTFHGSASPVTLGSVVQIAREHGIPLPERQGVELDWNSEIGGREDAPAVDPAWVEDRELPCPPHWSRPEDAAAELVRYLETLFEASDNVGYVTEVWEKDGKYLPAKGCWDRTAGELIQSLMHCKGDIGAVLGDYNPEAGAWIRFNPLDGHGCKNENVTEFRYALVESDEMEISRQNALIRELRLPVACLTHSGGKSLHAIVHIDAANFEEYRKRVEYLYSVLQKNGMCVDTQNKNPSRLSRMPGIMRGNRQQYLIDTNIGCASFSEWKEWIESANDDLPDPESMESVWDSLPPLSPPLIEGVLRQGHKMLLAGPSKAGKSYALIELCIAIAEGKRWLAWQCAQGRVLYVNLELDRASCLHRFRDVYTALGIPAANIGSIDVWNLRGHAVPMDKLAPKLIRRAAKKNYIAIVIDPIYKIITGDENSADQMAYFCNQFDRVASELGAAVIYCHHHSKGLQGGKRAMDRASGSGVFARDPDAMLDLIELDVTEELYTQEVNRAEADACARVLSALTPGWENRVSQDDRTNGRAMRDAVRRLMPENSHGLASIDAACAAARRKTAWRIEGTLREFAKFDPVNLWFDYPVHRMDPIGALGDIDPEEAVPTWQKAHDARRKHAKEERRSKKEAFEDAVESCCCGDPPTVNDLITWYSDSGRDVSARTIREYVRQYGYVIDRNRGNIIIKKGDEKPWPESEKTP